MDFTLDDEQQAIAELADRILGEQCPPETLRTLESGPVGERLAADAWAALAGADLLGLAVATEAGGSGRGLLAAGLVAQQVGRHVALVPYWTATAATLTVARWGDEAQRSRWLPGALNGDGPLAVALWEPAEQGSASEPGVVATPDGDGWRLEGTKTPVPWASSSRALLVPARLDGGVAVFVVPLGAEGAQGLELIDEAALTGEPVQTVHFRGVPVAPDGRLGDDTTGEAVLGHLVQQTSALLCLTTLGVCEEALAMTARYVTERQQFGTPIGTFQAVGHRCADAYIDTEAIRLTALQAVWQLDSGLDAGDALAVAAFWATEGGQRVVHAAQHLHGGIGMDTDYPLHRYFRWAKTIEGLLGGTHAALLRVGASLAAGELATT